MTTEVGETSHGLPRFTQKRLLKSMQISEIRVQKSFETIIQITKFMTVGVLNTAIDAGAYLMLTRWLGFGSALILAKALAYVVGMVNSFFWNRSWTFGDNGNVWHAAGLFALTHVFALAINAGTMAFVLDVLHLPEIVALGGATAASFIWNFVLNKVLVFRDN